ncbi:MAG TPA: alpha/beta hydrolase [Pyrinomonadaceae bacterium]|jgi:pimeloyl-ACP methyl ester carboxylesterase
MQIAFRDYGGEFPLVLLHAFPLSRKMWNGNIEAITDSGFRLILPDLPGFGQTPNSSAATSIEEMAVDIAELLDSLKIEKAIIGGLSMGGYVALNLYRLFPEKFAGLILCDTTSSLDTEEKRNQRFELIKKIETHGIQILIEKMLPNLIGEHTKKSNRKLVARIEEMFAETNSVSVISALRAMAERKDHTDLLDKINVPTVLIFGEEDQITNLHTARVMNEKINDSRLYTIKNAGHYSNLEQPDEFNEALKNYIEDLKI